MKELNERLLLAPLGDKFLIVLKEIAPVKPKLLRIVLNLTNFISFNNNYIFL